MISYATVVRITSEAVTWVGSWEVDCLTDVLGSCAHYTDGVALAWLEKFDDRLADHGAPPTVDIRVDAATEEEHGAHPMSKGETYDRVKISECHKHESSDGEETGHDSNACHVHGHAQGFVIAEYFLPGLFGPCRPLLRRYLPSVPSGCLDQDAVNNHRHDHADEGQ